MSSSGGASATSHKNVGAKKAFCDEVKKEMWKILTSLEERLIWNSEEYAEGGSGDDEYVEDGDERRFKKMRVSTQSTLSKKDFRERACQEIASFFYNNDIPLDAAKSDEFRNMFELVGRHGIGFQPPSYHEISGKYLKRNVDLTKEAREEHRAYWKKTGCTIVINDWTNKRNRTILNFLVNSPKGTIFWDHVEVSPMYKTVEIISEMMDHIVDDVGEENVIQVITNYTELYKAAGEMLMEKRNKLYWTPCAAHCIGLMLEDFEKKIPFHRETIVNGKTIITYLHSRTPLISLLGHFNEGKGLVRPAATRFAMSYLILAFLYGNRGALLRMLRSIEWKSNQFAKTKNGKFVQNVVMDKGFWKNVVICLKGAYPIVKVLRLVDSNENQAMGFIYEEMDRAKKKIQSVFNGVKESYMPLWDIIDERWNNLFYRPLHATGYYLNPRVHYSPEFKSDGKVKGGLLDCLMRIVGNNDKAAEIDLQMDDFKCRSKSFGCVAAKNGVKTKTPSQWWDSFGNEHPELQKFAISVLSLTCSSSRIEHIRSAFEKVHSRRRNYLEQTKTNDVVYVMINSKLAKKQARKANEDSIDDLSCDDDWFVDNDGSFENLDSDLDIPNEEDSTEVGEDASGGVGASADDLENANLDADEFEVNHLEDDDYDHNLNGLLDF